MMLLFEGALIVMWFSDRKAAKAARQLPVVIDQA